MNSGFGQASFGLAVHKSNGKIKKKNQKQWITISPQGLQWTWLSWLEERIELDLPCSDYLST